MRKQPVGELLPSAHAVDREYRVMRALGPAGVPVPRTVLFHADRDVVGTPFYLMEKLEGRVFAAHSLPGLTSAERGAMYRSMAETLATLHRVDPAAAGLADYGKPGNYFARQVARWSRQWESSRTRENPALDRLIAWLPGHIPEGDETVVCHGDFRIGNLMFDPVEPRVIAILDWELSTLGHPLADVGYNVMGYFGSVGPSAMMGGVDLKALGIPTCEEYVAAYCRRTGRARIDNLEFYVVFAMFRLAAIMQGIAMRAKLGNASSANADGVGKLARTMADTAWGLAQRAS
jgi:aminoglycoside phosphotransferase (APT) family kinase protein